jgi:hypothetical protein
MTIVVLLLWAFTAGAGFYLLVTSNPGRPAPGSPGSPGRVARPAPSASASAPASASASASAEPAPASAEPITAEAAPAEPVLAQPVLAERVPASASAASPAGPATGASRTAPSRQDARDPWAPNSLVAARQAPLVPGARALGEFAHPATGIVGLGFWLGFTLVHAQVLGWIGFGLAAATACLGLAWFAANTRAARRSGSAASAPSFAPRFVALHGSAAAITIALAALTALLLHG